MYAQPHTTSDDAHLENVINTTLTLTHMPADPTELKMLKGFKKKWGSNNDIVAAFDKSVPFATLMMSTKAALIRGVSTGGGMPTKYFDHQLWPGVENLFNAMINN